MAPLKPSLKTKSIPLAFFGTADFSAPSLSALLQAGYNVSLVVTKPDTAHGRGRELKSPPIKRLAKCHNLPIIQPETKNKLEAELSNYSAIKHGVVVAYGMILPAATLKHFTGGLINVHASLLPKWRGPSPIEAAILSGDSKSGVSLIRLESKMDSGPVYANATQALNEHTDRLKLHRQLQHLGAEVLLRHLDKILSGSLKPKPQDESQATYCQMIKKTDGHIDWNKPAEVTERSIRAYLGWPGSRTQIGGKAVTITAAKTTLMQGLPGKHFLTAKKELGVYCGQDALIIKALQPAGKREMSGADFARGNL